MQYHTPIMLKECIEYLNIKPDGTYMDATMGGGGHSEAVLERLKGGRLIAVDRDRDSILYAGERLSNYRDKLTIVHDNYENAAKILDSLEVRLDGVILDLGISSHQIDEAERGFSYMKDASLDMRMDQTQYLTAFNVVNEYSEGELERIIRDYGEDSYYKRIAAGICRARESASIRTTLQLAGVIEAALPKNLKGGHPAKKTFQAIRIEVNGELSGLRQTIIDLSERLNEGGRMLILSFHSIEDRIVKETLRELATDCVCDKRMPVCVCGHKAELRLLAKAERAGAEELTNNPRAASAKLRVAEKCGMATFRNKM